MLFRELYDLAVKMGMKADPRGPKGVATYLAHLKKQYAEMPPRKKEYFDRETLTNPYSDTRILFGKPETQVKRIMVGIDAEEAELLLADRLTEKGKKIDAVITHHPAAHALTALHDVMDIQVDMFADAGVPENVAQSLFDIRKEAVQRRFSPVNHSRAVDAARLLNMPFMAVHTVWDNLGHQYLKSHIAKKSYYNIDELMDALLEVPEFKEAALGKAGPLIVSGSGAKRPGRIIVGFTGGTNPSKELYVELAKAGVGTLVEMHLPEDVVQELRSLHINVIDTGHMASDSIGANLYLDQVEKRGVEIIPCSGFMRTKRKV
jgi:putative NIF3 family GTP cyclohydrolase 1 type 2